jgi:hypothetical protein
LVIRVLFERDTIEDDHEVMFGEKETVCGSTTCPRKGLSLEDKENKQ